MVKIPQTVCFPILLHAHLRMVDGRRVCQLPNPPAAPSPTQRQRPPQSRGPRRSPRPPPRPTAPRPCWRARWRPPPAPPPPPSREWSAPALPACARKPTPVPPPSRSGRVCITSSSSPAAQPRPSHNPFTTPKSMTIPQRPGAKSRTTLDRTHLASYLRRVSPSSQLSLVLRNLAARSACFMDSSCAS